jgi:hypothetical protein
MTTEQIAKRWVELVRQNKDQQAIEELYSPEIESIENNASGEYMVYKGLAGKAEKNQMWEDMVSEVHEVKISDPVIGDRAFACSGYMDITYVNPDWGRLAMTELCVLEVKDGKIVREEYIY